MLESGTLAAERAPEFAAIIAHNGELLQRMHDDPQLRDTYSRQALAASRNYSFTHELKRLCDLYERVC